MGRLGLWEERSPAVLCFESVRMQGLRFAAAETSLAERSESDAS